MRLKKGFTLVELLVVISIIGILSAVLLPAVRGVIDKAKVAKVLATVSSLETATAMYYDDIGSFPVYEYDYRYEPQSYYHYLSMNQGGRWNGPYLKEPLNWDDNIVDGDTDCWQDSSNFDLDRNGSNDGVLVFMWWLSGVPDSIGQQIDLKIDGIPTAGENWRCSGRVKQDCVWGGSSIVVYR